MSTWQFREIFCSLKWRTVCNIKAGRTNRDHTRTSYVIVARFWLRPFGLLPFELCWNLERRSYTYEQRWITERASVTGISTYAVKDTEDNKPEIINLR